MPIQDEMIGRQVRDLKITEVIGRGGMGAVYRAEHLLLREPRAVKVIREESFRFPHAVERFQREARIAVRLKHPNLVLIHDFFVEAGDYFLVMEYLTGESLAKRIRTAGPFTAEETCRIGIQCCAGLGHAHDMGIVHRDLSPENILLVPSPAGPIAKIIDFGIARAAFSTGETDEGEGEMSLTLTGEFLGKPKYASPEQAGRLRGGEKLDHRSDIYSFGLILYQMVTGDLPFHSETPLGYLGLHLSELPPRPTAVNPGIGIPVGLESLILRCLEKDRNARFQSCHDLASALARMMEPPDEPATIAAPQPSAAEETPQSADLTLPVARPVAHVEPARPPGPSTRRRLAWAGGMALAVVAAAAGGFAILSIPGKAPVPRDGASALLSAPATPSPGPIDAAQRSTASPGSEPTTGAATDSAGVAPVPSAEREPEPRVGIPEVPPLPPAAATPIASVLPAVPSIPAPPGPPAEPAPSEARAPSGRPTPLAALQTPVPLRTPAPRPSLKPAPTPPPFPDGDAVERAFEEALAFEKTHSREDAIAHWNSFLRRSPSRDYEQKAKRRLTDLNLGGMPKLVE